MKSIYDEMSSFQLTWNVKHLVFIVFYEDSIEITE